MPAFKIASGDLRNTPLLRHVASLGKPMLVSTGGATMEDVDRAVETILPINAQLCFLQCTAATRPTSRSSNLRVITTFRERYPELVIGLSDHQDGIAMALVAYMLGARVIEKHFTLNHTWKGTDHAFSLMPEGMRKLVRDLRRVAGGARRRRQAAAPDRGAAAQKMGKKLVAARDLAAGSRAHRRTTSPCKSPADGGLAAVRARRSCSAARSRGRSRRTTADHARRPGPRRATPQA